MVVPLTEEGEAWGGAAIFAVLSWSGLTNIEEVVSERAFGPQWKGLDRRFKFGTH